MPIVLQPTHLMSAGSTRIVRVNCTHDLDDGSSLVGVPTVTEVTTTGLTLSNKKVNEAEYTDAYTGEVIAVGKAIQFTVSSLTAGSYRIRVSCPTDSSPAETLVYDLKLSVV